MGETENSNFGGVAAAAWDLCGRAPPSQPLDPNDARGAPCELGSLGPTGLLITYGGASSHCLSLGSRQRVISFLLTVQRVNLLAVPVLCFIIG